MTSLLSPPAKRLVDRAAIGFAMLVGIAFLLGLADGLAGTALGLGR